MGFTTSERGGHPRVDNFAALPAASSNVEVVYMCNVPQGVYMFGTRKNAGLYKSNGTTWEFMGVDIPQVLQTELDLAVETAPRRMSPADVKSMIESHGLGTEWEADGLDLVPTTTGVSDIGSISKSLEKVYTEAVHFIPDGSGTTVANIDADAAWLDINTGTDVSLGFGTGNSQRALSIDAYGSVSFRGDQQVNLNGAQLHDVGRLYFADDESEISTVSDAIRLQHDNGTVELKTDRFVPLSDNALYLGSSGQRWKKIYAVNATISTSDKRLKNDHGTIPISLLDVWDDHVSLNQWSWKDDDTAALHIGIYAQDVISAFNAAGLDWRKYDVVSESSNGTLQVSHVDIQYIEHSVARRARGGKVGT